MASNGHVPAQVAKAVVIGVIIGAVAGAVIGLILHAVLSVDGSATGYWVVGGLVGLGPRRHLRWVLRWLAQPAPPTRVTLGPGLSR